jgi:hypothetical protein
MVDIDTGQTKVDEPGGLQDDEDDAIMHEVAPVENGDFNRRIMIDILVRIPAAVYAPAILKPIVRAIFQAEPKMMIKKRTDSTLFSNMAGYPTDGKEFQEYFQTTTTRRQGKVRLLVEMHVVSTRTIAQIKQQEKQSYAFLLEHSVYIKDHKFDSLELSDVGYLDHKSARFTCRSRRAKGSPNTD